MDSLLPLVHDLLDRRLGKGTEALLLLQLQLVVLHRAALPVRAHPARHLRCHLTPTRWLVHRAFLDGLDDMRPCILTLIHRRVPLRSPDGLRVVAHALGEEPAFCAKLVNPSPKASYLLNVVIEGVFCHIVAIEDMVGRKQSAERRTEARRVWYLLWARVCWVWSPNDELDPFYAGGC